VFEGGRSPSRVTGSNPSERRIGKREEFPYLTIDGKGSGKRLAKNTFLFATFVSKGKAREKKVR